MRPKARNTTRNPALPRPARWRAAKSREAAVVPALSDFGTDPAHPVRDAVLQRLGRWRAKASDAVTGRSSGESGTDRATRPGPAAAAGIDAGAPEATGGRAKLQGVRRLGSRLSRPITGRVSAVRRKSDLRSAPETKGPTWVRHFPSPVPGKRRADDDRGRGRSGRAPGASDADEARRPGRFEGEAGDQAGRRGRFESEADRSRGAKPTGDPAGREGARSGRVSRESDADEARQSGRFDHAAEDQARQSERFGREAGDKSRRPGRFGRTAGDKSRGRSRMRLGRKSPARPADWIPVRYRVARAVGAAASALPESRAVRVGTAVAELVAANQGVIKAGLTAASAVPVLRPYVKVAATAMGAIAVARRIARAKNAASDVAAAFRGPATPGMAHAGNGFGLDAKALPSKPASGRESASAPAGKGAGAPGVPAQTNGRGSETARPAETALRHQPADDRDAKTGHADNDSDADAAKDASGTHASGVAGDAVPAQPTDARGAKTGHADNDSDADAETRAGDGLQPIDGREAEEVDPSAALQSKHRRDAEGSTEQGREP